LKFNGDMRLSLPNTQPQNVELAMEFQGQLSHESNF